MNNEAHLYTEIDELPVTAADRVVAPSVDHLYLLKSGVEESDITAALDEAEDNDTYSRDEIDYWQARLGANLTSREAARSARVTISTARAFESTPPAYLRHLLTGSFENASDVGSVAQGPKNEDDGPPPATPEQAVLDQPEGQMPSDMPLSLPPIETLTEEQRVPIDMYAGDLARIFEVLPLHARKAKTLDFASRLSTVEVRDDAWTCRSMWLGAALLQLCEGAPPEIIPDMSRDRAAQCVGRALRSFGRVCIRADLTHMQQLLPDVAELQDIWLRYSENNEGELGTKIAIKGTDLKDLIESMPKADNRKEVLIKLAARVRDVKLSWFSTLLQHIGDKVDQQSIRGKTYTAARYDVSKGMKVLSQYYTQSDEDYIYNNLSRPRQGLSYLVQFLNTADVAGGALEGSVEPDSY